MVYEYNDRERLFTGHTGRLFFLITFIWLSLSLTSRLLPPLLPAIIDDLAITAFLAGVAISAQRVAGASMEYPSGRVADQLSRTLVLVVCIVFVIIGVTILSVSTSFVILLIGLVVFGIGRGMYSPASRALLSDIYRRKRGSAFGINMMGSEFAGILGAGIAILIVSIATWRAAFLPIAIILLPLLVAFFLLSREPIHIESINLGAKETGGRIFGDPSLRWILVVYCLYVLSASGVSTFLPLFLIEVHGVSFAFASSAFALLYVMGIVAKPISGYLSDVIPRLYTAGGSLVVASGGLAVLITAPSGTVAIGGVLVYALGYRGLPPGLQAYLMDQFPDKSMAGDLGAMRTVYLFVGALGPFYAGFASDTIGFVPAFTSFFLFYMIAAGMLLWSAKDGE